MTKIIQRTILIAGLFVLCAAHLRGEEQRISFARQADRVQILRDGKPLATYVYRNAKILRPYFCDVYAPDGKQVTRNHPPQEGKDATDHDTMHPGIWLAFGDLSGADFWRNKGRVEHVGFVEEPTPTVDGGQFIVRNRYLAGDEQHCEELCKIAIWARPKFSIIAWESRFSGAHQFYFGDQEEMGLGIRVATPLTVKNGGTITNSDQRVNEKQVWGKPAEWCDYSGMIDNEKLGLMIVPDPLNFRRSWFHARDYGVLVANPFGVHAFTDADPSRVVVQVGDTLQLRFAVVAHSGDVDLNRMASDALTLLNATR